MRASPRGVVSWSGGKDSCLALMRMTPRVDVRAALTMFDAAGARSRSHGLRRSVIAAQTARLGVESVIACAEWPDYTEVFVAALTSLANAGVDVAIFGDIFEDSHREWAETVSARAGLRAELPLWGESTTALTREFLDRGGEARFVTIRTPHLTPDRLGQPLTPADVEWFGANGVDPGGERGEYHTVVTACPLFRAPLALTPGRKVQTGACWAVDFDVSPDGVVTTPAAG
jgi:uncharacterized protein (TIGR00290 family)